MLDAVLQQLDNSTWLNVIKEQPKSERQFCYYLPLSLFEYYPYSWQPIVIVTVAICLK